MSEESKRFLFAKIWHFTSFLFSDSKPIFAVPKNKIMKKDIHPANYRTVVFKDISLDKSWLGKSTANTKETAKWEDGNEYPLVKLEISSESHPFFTGKLKLVDTAGRIDKFKKRYTKKAAEEKPTE